MESVVDGGTGKWMLLLCQSTYSIIVLTKLIEGEFSCSCKP